MNTPLLWNTDDSSDLKSIRGVCFDIDDTFSTHGKLTAEAYTSLWALKNAGYHLVPITGRPAGWCDHFARFWPVDAIVGENGAFSFFMNGGRRKRIDTPCQSSQEELKKLLTSLSQKILKKFPQARWASDQPYREFDLAVDTCEDVAAWSRADIDALLELCHTAGAHAKLSSIHVNTWFGNYDKRGGFENLVKNSPLGLPQSFDSWIFIGDSPNDESLFSAFKNSVGVANLTCYLDRLKSPPRWITESESGKGFSEMAAKLIALQK